MFLLRFVFDLVLGLVFGFFMEIVWAALKSIAQSIVKQVPPAVAEAARLIQSGIEGVEEAVRREGLLADERPQGPPEAPALGVAEETQLSDCPECRAYNPPDSTFCAECGSTLGIQAV